MDGGGKREQSVRWRREGSVEGKGGKLGFVFTQRALEAFTEVAKSSFGCLSIHGRICVATDKW